MVELFDRGNGFGETARLVGFCLGNNLVFEFSQCDQKFAGFERLDDICIGPHLACFLGPERLQFPHCQENLDASRLAVFLEPLADLQAGVARHVDVQDNEIWLVLGNLLQGRRAIIDSDHLIAGIAKDLPAHVLGGYAVVGEQYFSRQGDVLWWGEMSRN